MMRGSRRGAWRAAGLRMSVLAAALLVAPPLGAQSFSFGAVRVEGNQRIEESTILARLGISRGQTVTAGELNAAAQQLRASGLFETVEVIPQGSTLLVRVVEWPTINRISFEGNSAIRDEALSALVGSVERRVFSPTQAEQDAEAIARAYAERGRINAVVVPAIIRHPDNRVDLVFQIAEGGITEVERISFVGNRAFGDRRLRGVLETRQAGLLRQIIRADTFVADRIAFDRQALTDFYRSRGHADARVTSVDVNLTRERDAYLITFTVEEGQQFRFGEVTVTSAIPEADPALFRQVVRTRPGQVYSPLLIENDIARIENLAIRQGIPFLRVEPRITRDDRNLLLAVEYALVPGARIFVERIDIEGNRTTLDRVIRSQFRTVEGDPFNPREIRESANRIRALGYFVDAEVEARQGSGPDQVIIDVNVEEQPTGSLSFGANYSTDYGPALLASLSERNFLGRGQDLAFELQWGRDNQLFSFDFTEPQFLGRDVAASIDLLYRTTQRASALYDTDVFRFSPSLTFPVSERGRLELLYALDYSDITNVDDEASDIIKAEAAEGGVLTNALGYTYSFDTRRDNLETPTRFFFRFGQEFGFGDSSFIRTRALASAETRILAEEVTLRATLEGGLLDYSEGASRVTDRFFLGSRVMRGFERGGIGPRDADTDDALGGNAFAVLRLEAEFPLFLPEEYGFSGGAFIDYGSVWDVGDLRGVPEDRVLYNDFTPRTVAGLSLFWTTPIGPLRFNFSRPIDVEEFDRPNNFDITVSTRF